MSAVDETDLTVRATLEVTSMPEEEEPCEQAARTTEVAHVNNDRRLLHIFCTRGLWQDHKTLLWRLGLLIFFTIVITLLETLLPDKTGMIARLLDTVVHTKLGNVSQPPPTE